MLRLLSLPPSLCLSACTCLSVSLPVVLAYVFFYLYLIYPSLFPSFPSVYLVLFPSNPSEHYIFLSSSLLVQYLSFFSYFLSTLPIHFPPSLFLSSSASLFLILYSYERHQDRQILVPRCLTLKSPDYRGGKRGGSAKAKTVDAGKAKSIKIMLKERV